MATSFMGEPITSATMSVIDNSQLKVKGVDGVHTKNSIFVTNPKFVLPHTLIVDLILAEYRLIGTKLTCGYQDNVVWVDLQSGSGCHKSKLVFYRCNGEGIWRKTGPLGLTWKKCYTMETRGEYVICTGLDISPIVRATFCEGKLSSMYTGSPMDCKPEYALTYRTELKKTVEYYEFDAMDNTHYPWFKDIIEPKECYYYSGVYCTSEYVGKKVKDTYLAQRDASNKGVTLRAVMKIMKEQKEQADRIRYEEKHAARALREKQWDIINQSLKGEELEEQRRLQQRTSDREEEQDDKEDEEYLGKTRYEWDCWNNIIKKVLVRKETRGYDSDDGYTQKFYDDTTIFTATRSHDNTGTTITLTGTPNSKIATVTIFDDAMKVIKPEPVIVWKV